MLKQRKILVEYSITHKGVKKFVSGTGNLEVIYDGTYDSFRKNYLIARKNLFFSVGVLLTVYKDITIFTVELIQSSNLKLSNNLDIEGFILAAYAEYRQSIVNGDIHEDFEITNFAVIFEEETIVEL
jgi:hypothetical protein